MGADMKNSCSASIALLPPVWRGVIWGLLLPAILLGNGFASGLVLLHAHGPEGRHEHVLPASVSRGDIQLLQVWHEGQHGVAVHSRREHVAHERVSHEGLNSEVRGGEGLLPATSEQHDGVGEIVAHNDEVPGHVPHGRVVNMTHSPTSRPQLQELSAEFVLPLGEQLPRVLVSAEVPLGVATCPPIDRDGRAVRRGRSKGALRVLCLSGALLI
ncbi:MAG: hypothetical protein ACI9EF_003071 [Pseudohongiellaceae bacterium]|jgi:hypothetical protein